MLNRDEGQQYWLCRAQLCLAHVGRRRNQLFQELMEFAITTLNRH